MTLRAVSIEMFNLEFRLGTVSLPGVVVSVITSLLALPQSHLFFQLICIIPNGLFVGT